jgi:hypothetical protein
MDEDAEVKWLSFDSANHENYRDQRAAYCHAFIIAIVIIILPLAGESRR